MKFCFVCGKKTDKLVEGYCEGCYNQKFNLVEVPEGMDVVICSKCKRIKSGRKWEEVGVEEFVKSNIKSKGNDVKIELKGNKLSATGTLEKSDVSKEESHELKVKLVKTLCLTCSQKLGGYFETTIQLRGNVTNSILNLVDQKINENSFYRGKTVKGGFDLYVGNKSVANDAAELLKKRYNFKISKSYKLFTKKDGRDLFRTVITIYCD
jgi:nonsense-mediated mRNA decay protein 3